MQKNCILLQVLLSVLDKTSLVCLSVCLLSRVLADQDPGAWIAAPSWEMSLIMSLFSSLSES